MSNYVRLGVLPRTPSFHCLDNFQPLNESNHGFPQAGKSLMVMVWLKSSKSRFFKDLQGAKLSFQPHPIRPFSSYPTSNHAHPTGTPLYLAGSCMFAHKKLQFHLSNCCTLTAWSKGLRSLRHLYKPLWTVSSAHGVYVNTPLCGLGPLLSPCRLGRDSLHIVMRKLAIF